MASLRRLTADHADLIRSELPPFYLFPASSAISASDDLSQLSVLLAGPSDTPYADGLWKLNLKIPHDYPAAPPKAFFKTKIWHPNVEESNGSVCLDTLKRDWQPKLTLRDILITISCLLINPNPDSALNSTAGKLLQEDWNEFARQAKLMTSIHARVPRSLAEDVLEAKRRGEDSQEEETTQIWSAPDDDVSDVEEDSKENDEPLLVVEARPASTHRRSTVLGKRPLAELPLPIDPDENQHEEKASSVRNIAANTPNLSSHMASISFKPALAYHPNPVLSSAASGTSPSPLDHGKAASSNRAPTALAEERWDRSSLVCSVEPAAKRIRSSQDTMRATTLCHFNQPSAPTTMVNSSLEPTTAVGLGIIVRAAPNTGSGSGASGVRKVGPTAGGRTRIKPRVGLRRL